MLEAALEPRLRRRMRRRMRRHHHLNLFGRLGDAIVEPPDSAKNSSASSEADLVGTFWHVTDWHVNEHMPADPDPCDMCRSAASPSSGCERPAAGKFGHANCDPSPAFLHAALKLMRREAPAPDFILAGGDWIGHIPQRKEGAASVRSAAALIATMLHEAFPSAVVMHSIGNHDTWPYYSRAPTWRDWEEAWRAEPRLGDAYVERLLPSAESLATWRAGGYYARPLWPRPQQYPAHSLEAGGGRSLEEEINGGRGPRRTLWGLTLNTNDLALSGGSAQLQWLAKALTAVRARGDAALLLGHIPPGPSHFELDSICTSGHYYQRAGGACWDGYAQRRLLKLLASFADVLPASYWGHHHTDSVRLVTDDDLSRAGADEEARARHLMFLTPSLTPRNPPHDPTLRLYKYSRRTGRPLDYAEWTLDVTRANEAGRAAWRATPSALRSSPLNLTDMGAPAWARALRALLHADHRPHSSDELDPADPFLQWVSAERCAREAYVASGRAQVPPLRKCKLAHLCAALHLADAPYAECIGQLT